MGDAQDRADYIRRLVLTRCPELTPADLALLAEPGLSPEIMDALLDTLDALEMRLVGFEQGLVAAPRFTH